MENNIHVIIAGRSVDKAKKLISKIDAVNEIKAVGLDINIEITPSLCEIKPDIVIHTSGPFQSQGYDVAEVCINLGIHYIDLADGREFVNGITRLDGQAKEKNVLVISGASSVPCLTSSIVDFYKDEFETLETLDYGITTAQKTARGLATTAAILGYTGKPIKTIINGEPSIIYGWQGLKLHKYKELGWRLLGYCDVPDLAIFPELYPQLKTIRFYAGLEIPFIHVTLWFLSYLVRFGLIKTLQPAAAFLLRVSYLFDWLGTDKSAFHMELEGKDKYGKEKTVSFELTARSGDGPYIPCMPAILIAKKLANHEISDSGAYPCIGFITLDEYLAALSGMDISWTCV